MGFFSVFASSENADPDESVLIQLKKAESDLSRPHKIEFFLYFPSQSVAEQAALRIREAGFQVEVRRAAKGNDWLCFATKTMVPELSALQEIRGEFSSLAASLKGEYDGWGTPIEK
jgi:regulator of RNase E activity RraB